MTTLVIENPLRRDPAVTLPVTIRLEQADTDLSDCRTLPEREYRDSYYTAPKYPLSVAVLPSDGHTYEYGCSTVARQNARYAANHGYRHQLIDRAEWEDDLYELRSSTPFRQGRNMPDDYMQRKTYGSDKWPDPSCVRHRATVHGAIDNDGRLRGYMQTVQCGEVARVNTILGHADYLQDRLMWLLMLEAVKWHIDECQTRFFLYYTHMSGHGPGLRYFKERLGFRSHTVTWEF